MKGDNKDNRVLIADDDMFIRKLIARGLDGLATIEEVSDGAEVEEAYKRIMPDILFLDIHLPTVSGGVLLDKILAIDPKAYVIMISSDSTTENVMGSVSKGAKTFLAKPFGKERLHQIFHACPTIRFMD